MTSHGCDGIRNQALSALRNIQKNRKLFQVKEGKHLTFVNNFFTVVINTKELETVIVSVYIILQN